ncbi:MAG TPA: AEC family transporter [bacterium]|nr:AEC family transporter [bacterium]
MIGPVLLIGAAGYALGRARVVEAQPLTAVSVAVLVPAISFYAVTTGIGDHSVLARMTIYLILQLVLIGAITAAVAAACGWDRTRRTGLMLATLFSNAGNAGLPLALFAWGTRGLAAALAFFAVQAVIVNMLAAYLAAQADSGARRALRTLARLPVTYAVAVGLALDVLGIVPPAPVAKAAELLANGAVAVMLLLIGVQLAQVRPHGEWPAITVATVIRLGAAPVLAWVTAPWVGLEGVARQTSILQSSLPTAVTAAIWASEFGAAPALVSGAVIVTTLASPLPVAVLLTLLR